MYIDSHCHLDFDVFTPSRKALIQTALAANITHFFNPAVSFANWHKVIELSQAFPFIIPALGLHPVFCSEHTLDHLSKLSKWITANNIKFIGEIGLDKRYKDNYESQLLFFEAQIKIANKLKKPVIIHAVKSHHDIIGIIKKENFKYGGIIHAFNANKPIANTYINLGFKLGIGSTLYHPNSALRRIIHTLDLDSLVLETDSPDMAPPNWDTKLNTPLSIIPTCQLLADILKKPANEIQSILYRNTLKLCEL